MSCWPWSVREMPIDIRAVEFREQIRQAQADVWLWRVTREPWPLAASALPETPPATSPPPTRAPWAASLRAWR